mmetsp:Transcript_140514/g.436944  ORF Transcript_140514/g.436944 Transcript_140514/m.436944 type:complete len:242 (-) Transcript_140514:334-1059(-)
MPTAARSGPSSRLSLTAASVGSRSSRYTPPASDDSGERVTKYGSITALVSSCMPNTVGTIVPDGRPGRPSERKPAKAAAQASSRLKRPSRQGCTTGAKGSCSNGLMSQKFSDRSRTSTHVAGSSRVASGPGKMPLEKKTMVTYRTQAISGRARRGSAMSLLATPRTESDEDPGLKGAGSGTSKPDRSLPVAGSALYMEHPRVNGRAWPSFSTCHCTPTTSPASATSSMQKRNVGGRASATL